MALIPPDAGVRLRMQTEASLQPITPVKDAGIDLPQLQTGQAFTARILEALPENTYRALIAGKQMTLSLPQGAQAGDSLELVVVDRTPKLIIAQTAAVDEGPAVQGSAQNTTLSQAARLIGSLLPAEGEAPPAAELNRGRPVLAQPPASGSELAPMLDKAVSRSGLFYESHQALWVAGRLPLVELLQEPQGRQAPTTPSPTRPDASNSTAPGSTALAASETLRQAQGRQSPLTTLPMPAEIDLAAVARGQAPAAAPSAEIEAYLTMAKSERESGGTSSATSLPERAPATPPPNAPNSALAHATPPTTTPASSSPSTAAAQPNASSPASAPSNSARIPDEIRPLVQQQLDAVATQRLAWHGELWPGQRMDWQIQWEEQPRDRSMPDQAADTWSTTVSLTTPRLGRIDAALQLGGGGVRVNLATPYGATAADLRDALPLLAEALQAAGVPLLGAQVQHEEV